MESAQNAVKSICIVGWPYQLGLPSAYNGSRFSFCAERDEPCFTVFGVAIRRDAEPGYSPVGLEFRPRRGGPQLGRRPAGSYARDVGAIHGV